MKIAAAEWCDRGLLFDIDLKCFEEVWSQEYWSFWFHETRVVFLAQENGKPVGFAACALMEDGLIIEKIGVKKDYRNQGVTRLLFKAAQDLADQHIKLMPIYLVIPEFWMYPGYKGKKNGLAGWTKRVGLLACRSKMLLGYFHINGESIDGIRFVLER